MEEQSKPLRNKSALILAVFLVLAGIIVLIIGLANNLNPKEQPSSPDNQVLSATNAPEVLNQPSEDAQVKRVVDGDTIDVEINGQEKKVRYIGIDTPETVDPRRPVGCFGKEASNENKKLVEGKQVMLTKDVSDTDKFGRLLRFVYIKQEDGSLIFVNDYLVRQGFARASTYPPDVKFAEQFGLAEKEARENNRGLWSKCIINK